ncbi:MAG: tripartite tricarboxylate transporter substrate binding protein [Burkholderiales bacterium]
MIRIAVALAAALLVANNALAQAWPAKPIRIIVNIAAGGVADNTIRLMSPALAETLKQPVVIENRAGGEGYIGLEAVVRAPADGYTFLFAAGSGTMITPHIVDRKDIDVLSDLVPVAPTVRITMYLTVPTTSPSKNLTEFLAYLRANPGKASYGSAGTGSALHLAAEVFKRDAKVDMQHVPFKGAGPAMQALLGGHVDCVFDPGIGLANAKAGKTRLIAVASGRRHPDFPDVPTLAEVGIKEVDGGPFFGVYAPKGTPAEIVQRMNAAVMQAMSDPTVRQRFEAGGLEIAAPMTPDAFAKYVRSESERWGKLVRELGVKQ